MAVASKMDAPSWPAAIHAALKAYDVRQVAYVPDGGHTELLRRVHDDPAMTPVLLTSEQEGVGVLTGAWLGGQRGVLVMQSSGVGNCVNMLSLMRACRFPLVMFVTMRGEWAEFNPWQVPMGSIVAPVLGLCDARVYRAESADDLIETAQAAIDLCFAGDLVVAVLVSQRLIGRKQWTR